MHEESLAFDAAITLVLLTRKLADILFDMPKKYAKFVTPFSHSSLS
jgi:hypothetical protein